MEELIKKRMQEAVRINERNDVKANKILKDIQSDIIKELGEEAVAYLPSRESLRKKLCYRRDVVEGLPGPCHDYEEMKTENFPEFLTTTKEGYAWLRYNKRKIPAMEKRIIIFISDHGKKMLEQSNIWLCDGTFKVRLKVLRLKLWKFKL